MKEFQSLAFAMQSLSSHGEPAVLCTLVQVEGSFYRKPGTRLLLTPDGKQSWGMISGGCLEQDLLEKARTCLKDQSPRRIRYDSTTREDALFGTGSGCLGVVDIWLEPLQVELAENYAGMFHHISRNRKPGLCVTVLNIEGASRLKTGTHFFCKNVLDLSLLPSEFHEWAQKAVADECCFIGTIEHSKGSMDVFFEFVQTPVQLVVCGAEEDVLPLTRFGGELGWQIQVIDVRKRASSGRKFPLAEKVILADIETALQQIHVDSRTGFVVMNHHLDHDKECLRSILSRDPTYVGVLGPEHRLNLLLELIAKESFQLTTVRKRALHGPVGLPIGSQTPEEIALSIAAEITRTFAPVKKATSSRIPAHA